MVSILTEPKYSGSVWCDALLKSLTEQLRIKRIPYCEVLKEIPPDSEAVFIIASDYSWILEVIKQLNEANIMPILICNRLENFTSCNYSCVCSDIYGSIKDLIAELKPTGKTHIAAYGINTSSISDISRVDGLFALKENHFDSIEVFTNTASLKECFEKFYAKKDMFDAVICSNDFAAISLIQNLTEKDPDALNKLKIFSCAQNELSKYYSGKITSINMNFEQYGKAAVFVFNQLKKQQYMSAITVQVRWSLRKNDLQKRTDSVKIKNPEITDEFYNDTELCDMLEIDKILCKCDSTDRKILCLLANGYSYDYISDKCYLTESGIKYRLKNMLSVSQCRSKELLLKNVKKYIP